MYRLYPYARPNIRPSKNTGEFRNSFGFLFYQEPRYEKEEWDEKEREAFYLNCERIEMELMKK